MHCFADPNLDRHQRAFNFTLKPVGPCFVYHVTYPVARILDGKIDGLVLIFLATLNHDPKRVTFRAFDLDPAERRCPNYIIIEIRINKRTRSYLEGGCSGGRVDVPHRHVINEPPVFCFQITIAALNKHPVVRQDLLGPFINGQL